ncbi:transposase [Pseudoflavonifractor phocaeensis]|uniref:transposase n=1 Tax=Pseudoflavonifractor phocaeensis TaxID=1870988 RepID=UPI00399CC5E7
MAYKTGTSQSVNLVLDTIRLAMQKEKKVAAELQLHSDQGSQYTSQAYFDLTKEYGITPSMSRRGNCYDNAMAENFFSILKTECIYRHQAATFEEARRLIDKTRFVKVPFCKSYKLFNKICIRDTGAHGKHCVNTERGGKNIYSCRLDSFCRC